MVGGKGIGGAWLLVGGVGVAEAGYNRAPVTGEGVVLGRNSAFLAQKTHFGPVLLVLDSVN